MKLQFVISPGIAIYKISIIFCQSVPLAAAFLLNLFSHELPAFFTAFGICVVSTTPCTFGSANFTTALGIGNLLMLDERLPDAERFG